MPLTEWVGRWEFICFGLERINWEITITAPSVHSCTEEIMAAIRFTYRVDLLWNNCYFQMLPDGKTEAEENFPFFPIPLAGFSFSSLVYFPYRGEVTRPSG